MDDEAVSVPQLDKAVSTARDDLGGLVGVPHNIHAHLIVMKTRAKEEDGGDG